MKFYTIFDVIKKMNESSEEMTILKYENMMSVMFASPLLFFGAIANFLSLYFIFHHDLTTTAINSFVLLGFSMVFEILSRVSNNERFKSYIFTFLFSTLLAFLVVRYYFLLGPSLWTVSLIMVMIAMGRLKKTMLIALSLTIFVMGGYVWYESDPFQFGITYYITQSISFAMLFVVAFVIHRINTDRYYRINKQFKEAILKNREITALNKEITTSEEKVNHLAHHDHLTGLPNRLLLSKQLNRAIVSSNPLEKTLTIMFLDLDDFKMINDTMGHDIGDQLLVEIANRLVNTLRKCDTVARIGGDEFVIFIEDVEDMDYLKRVSEKILKCFDEPVRLNNQDCFVTISMGIAIYPTDGENAETLLKNADTAMYMAKGKGKNQWVLCNPLMKTKIVETMRMTNSLYRALERDELELYYQPQVCSTSDEIVGLEALIRWNHPGLGLVLPGEFISIAEKTGLIIPIGDWVLRTACSQNKAWQDAGLPRIRMGVNLSVKQFQNDSLVTDVKQILKETGLDCQYLELEITENAAIMGKAYIIETLDVFQKWGIHIAIDDFGTEYSSLNYLKQLPVDRIKIPMTFIQGIDVNTKDEAITKSLIVLAKSMGLGVIAEGVETKGQLDFLNQRMCDNIQGFYYHKPMPACEMEELLKKQII
ncbi:putative bifunctional diguanylate cyclase/phosphodiesterase [Acetobacterium sp.]|uniref:putative bifunctional diguanylate cyclase/phosphodiesterase n=1 Tax=Acetobacterium sp. TaxID=1872094 RepID=UPI002F3E20EC